MKQIKTLLFDLGGVVIDIDFNNVFATWAKHSNKSIEQLRENFTFDSYYEAHERGEIAATAFYESLRNSLSIDINDSQFEEGWNDIFIGEIAGIATLLKKAKSKFPMYVFSNSNNTHEKFWSTEYKDTLSIFDGIYNSSGIGKRKPEADAFQFVAQSMGYSPEEILFFDDSIENIIGAQNVGMQTVHVKSIADIDNALKR